MGTDPISQNRYAMAGGNPLSFIEWDGHIALMDGGGGATTVNPGSRDNCADTCDSHVTVSASSSTSGSGHHQDNNPLKGIGDFFGSAAKNVGDKAKQAGQWIYDNSSTISTIAGTAALVTAFIPGVDAISPALFAVSAVTGAMAAHKDMKQGNYGAAALDMLGVIPGGGALGSLAKDARLAINVGKDAKGALGFLQAARGGAEAISTADRVAVNGATAATAAGRLAHQTMDYGPGFEKEFKLPSGLQVDAINPTTRTVLELKPNNPRAITRGLNQLSRYLDELNGNLAPGATPWEGQVVTYG